MPEFRNYSPALVDASFCGFPIRGYADDTFIRAMAQSDSFSLEKGALGDVTRVQNLDESGEVSFTIMAATPTNDFLSGKALQDRESRDGYGPLLVKERGGTTIFFSEKAWIRKMPELEFAKSASQRVWVLDCAIVKVFLVGGNLL